MTRQSVTAPRPEGRSFQLQRPVPAVTLDLPGLDWQKRRMGNGGVLVDFCLEECDCIQGALEHPGVRAVDHHLRWRYVLAQRDPDACLKRILK